MAQFRIRVTLFKGQESIELARLTSLPEELSKLFRCIGEDAGVLPMDNHWRASHFADGSLEFDAATPENLKSGAVATCRRIANSVFSGRPQAAYDAGATERTLLQYGQVAKRIQTGETVVLSVLPALKKGRPKPYLVTDEVVTRLLESVRPFLEYHGTLIGVVHAFYKEAERPHFDLRDVSRNNLVKCFYRREMYSDVVSALHPRERRVHVSGLVRANRLTKVIDSIQADRLQLIEPLSEEEFEKFFGSAPHMTGDLDSADFVSSLREDD